MSYRFTLDNTTQDQTNKTLSGYSSYTGKVIFDYPFDKPDNEREKDEEKKDGDNKYLKSEEVFLTL